jgi:hypothetical protein
LNTDDDQRKSIGPQKNADHLKKIAGKLTLDEARLLSQVVCRDPLTGAYKGVFVVYAIFMVWILFWPFDFTFTGKTNHVRWSNPSPGIEFTGEGQAISPSPARSLFDCLVKGRGLALEVWVRPADTQQAGPARILSYSLNPGHRNFTLAQQGMDLNVRLRTGKTNRNATRPMLKVRRVFTHPQPVHLVVSYDFKVQKVYVDGNLRISSPIPGGHFNNWDPDYRLVLGNEATGDRPWLGKIAYVAIYDQSLDAREVREHYLDVKNWIAGAGELTTPGKTPVVQYRLDEKQGTRVTDSGSLSAPLTLEIPEKIETEKRPFLTLPHKPLVKWDSYAGYEMILNVFLFIPFAFLLHALLATRIGRRWKTIVAVIVAGGMTTLSVEILQHFSSSRSSSLTDVGTNLLGVLLGVLLKVIYDSLLRRNKAMIDGVLSPADPSLTDIATSLHSTPD